MWTIRQENSCARQIERTYKLLMMMKRHSRYRRSPALGGPKRGQELQKEREKCSGAAQSAPAKHVTKQPEAPEK